MKFRISDCVNVQINAQMTVQIGARIAAVHTIVHIAARIPYMQGKPASFTSLVLVCQASKQALLRNCFLRDMIAC